MSIFSLSSSSHCASKKEPPIPHHSELERRRRRRRTSTEEDRSAVGDAPPKRAPPRLDYPKAHEEELAMHATATVECASMAAAASHGSHKRSNRRRYRYRHGYCGGYFDHLDLSSTLSHFHQCRSSLWHTGMHTLLPPAFQLRTTESQTQDPAQDLTFPFSGQSAGLLHRHPCFSFFANPA